MVDDVDSSVSIFLVRVADEESRSIDVEPNVVLHDDFSLADVEFYKVLASIAMQSFFS